MSQEKVDWIVCFYWGYVGRKQTHKNNNPITTTSVVPKACHTVFIEDALPMDIINLKRQDNPR